jgi:osmotically inducible lipoprotein OsmB
LTKDTIMNRLTVSAPSASVYWRVALISTAAAATLALTACAGMSSRETSTVVGATTGAVIGGVVTGTTAGAAIGAAAGGVVGNEVSKKRDR